MNSHVFGTYVDANSHEVGFVTMLRLSFYPDMDFGFQGGLKRLDYVDGSSNALRLGADFKVAAARTRSGFPVDLSYGAGLGVDSGSLEPYASLGVAYASINTAGRDDTGIQWPFRLGAEYRFAPDLRFVMELREAYGTHFGDQSTWAIGTTFAF
jgi:hypothetical protein